ncbi:MAG TPA: glycine hydroxymethyltransferase [Candidatus Hydrogenedens sp.]|nr:glycine hydroxymethyltransferase [Candidatus Hydrogenedens sp.]
MIHPAIIEYLGSTPPDKLDSGFLGYLCTLAEVARVSPEVASGIVQELIDQRSYLKLIASENYSSLSTQFAMANLLNDKYAEGIPYQRFYEGCNNVDVIESIACEQAKKLFNAEHAYVQPHSGADANLVAYWAILTARIEAPSMEAINVKDPSKISNEQWNGIREKLGNQRLLGMDYYSGGHLTHGYRRNISGKMFESYSYTVNRETGLLDYAEIEAIVKEIKPLILLAGYSAYPRKINFACMRDIADKVGAVLMVDMAHFAGLVAGKVFQGDYDPVAHAHIVTSTTHKTLRGPRGGIVLCKKEFAEFVDKGCPMVLGGPLPHVLSAKAIAFTEANRPEFCDYARQIVRNAQILAEALKSEGLVVATGGTDNHLMLLNVQESHGLTGRQAAGALRACGITLNFNSLPFDPNGPLITSGLRLGTPAVTTLGMGGPEMKEIASIIKEVLDATKPEILSEGANAGKPSKKNFIIDPQVQRRQKARVIELLQKYPLYPNINLELIKKYFLISK